MTCPPVFYSELVSALWAATRNLQQSNKCEKITNDYRHFR